MACVLWSGRVWAVSVEAAHIIYLSRAEQHEGRYVECGEGWFLPV